MKTLQKFSAVVLAGLTVAACSFQSKPVDVAVAPRERAVDNRGREILPPMTATERADVARRFRIAATETAQPSVVVATDADQDVETTVTSMNHYGVDRTATAWIKLQAGTPTFNARIHWSSTTNLANFTAPAALPLPPSQLPNVTYAHSADPGLAQNIHAQGPGPLRTYCVGLAYTMDANYVHTNGGIFVWRSDDAGLTFPATSIARVAETAGTARTPDKPVIAVSWDTTGYAPDGTTATMGNVYVAWVDADQFAVATQRIMFSRSTDGGLTFSAPIQIAQGFVHKPQIVVPSNTGRVFVLYARYNANNSRLNDIEMWRSTNAGQTFAQLPTLTNTRLFSPPWFGGQNPRPDMLEHNTFARSVFQARYNPGVGLQVVWHGEQPSNTNRSDIYYAYYNGAWTTTNLTTNVFGDQFHPSFDYDNANNAVVTWYDRRNDPANRNYQLFYAKINTVGTILQTAVPASAVANDPTALTVSTGFVGDYQDIWFHNFASGGQWVSSSIRTNGANSDVTVTRITNP